MAETAGSDGPTYWIETHERCETCAELRDRVAALDSVGTAGFVYPRKSTDPVVLDESESDVLVSGHDAVAQFLQARAAEGNTEDG